jgi:hypothetical protein
MFIRNYSGYEDYLAYGDAYGGLTSRASTKSILTDGTPFVLKMVCLVLALVVAAGCTYSPTPKAALASPAPLRADLVVQSFEILEYKWLALGGFEATAEVLIKNIGSGVASAFDVGIVAVNREGKHVRFSFSSEWLKERAYEIHDMSEITWKMLFIKLSAIETINK